MTAATLPPPFKQLSRFGQMKHFVQRLKMHFPAAVYSWRCRTDASNCSCSSADSFVRFLLPSYRMGRYATFCGLLLCLRRAHQN